MKKIMFERERFGLEQAVLDGIKTMTRRAVRLPKDLQPNDVWNPVMGIDDKGKVYFTFNRIDGKQLDVYPRYQPGEVVAIAQRYRDIPIEQLMARRLDGKTDRWPFEELVKQSKGYNNKMFVTASLMLHQIRITDIKVERLNDISNGDCYKEGIVPTTWRQWHKQDLHDFSPQQYTDHNVWTLPKFREGIEDPWAESEPDEFMATTAQAAFAVLIIKMMGRKVWESNPWVFAYEYDLME